MAWGVCDPTGGHTMMASLLYHFSLRLIVPLALLFLLTDRKSVV